MGKEIVITGVAGFLGYSLSKRLLDLGYTVIGVDNSFQDKIKADRLNILKFYGDKFVFINVNIEDKKSLSEALSKYKPEKIIHFADKSSKNDDSSYIQSNLIGFSNMIDIAGQGKVPFIYASTHSVYTETNTGFYSETTDTSEPISIYAATKKSNEIMAHAYSTLFGLPTIGLRFFSVYGPWGNPSSVTHKFTDSILKGETIKVYSKGVSKRDYTYIDDAVDGILSAIKLDMKAYRKPYEIFNIGSGTQTDLLNMISFLEVYCEKDAKKDLTTPEVGAIIKSCADITKAKRVLGYNPKTQLADGLRTFVEWFKVYSVRK